MWKEESEELISGTISFNLIFTEEDLQKVLLKRPCHFNKWSFSLERWIPTIREDFPSHMTFWVEVEGIPSHYKKKGTFWSIGKALGNADKVDVQRNCLRVSINGDEPIHLERKLDLIMEMLLRLPLNTKTCIATVSRVGTSPMRKVLVRN